MTGGDILQSVSNAVRDKIRVSQYDYPVWLGV